MGDQVLPVQLDTQRQTYMLIVVLIRITQILDGYGYPGKHVRVGPQETSGVNAS